MSSLTAPKGNYQINYTETAHFAEFQIEFPTQEAVQLFKQTTELLQAQFHTAALSDSKTYNLIKFTQDEEDRNLTFMLTVKRLNSFLGSQFSQDRPKICKEASKPEDHSKTCLKTYKFEVVESKEN